ncbi:cardiolipin synthase [Paenibacillus sp. VTT E-133280]|jgi:cardiolipin synthase|uniref:cardiolipin synthase n=1 Tax=Paenibacillus TaxID=44249 RepID=UPI000BA0CF6D|nr:MULTISPECIES: cardiolipin synthase [unclassified Paenibacillus]MDH6371117.1 cardiolipin synthase [Paenibacillus sp. PastF-3]OZQ64932.1 cardiolipin synthase [Paenibacillus sp. VTT E-133280]OZQ80377.1 cardiolipin synthase [Paenibacillus sp. VTT E-133291]
MRRGLQSIIIIGAFIAFYYFGFGIFGSTAGTIISIFSTLTVISISLAIFMENRNPSTTMSWILLLALIPVLGLVFYFLFGQNVFKRRKYDKKAQRDLMAYERIENDALRTHQDWSVFDPSRQKLLLLSKTLARTPISFASETRILTNGEETFGTLLLELRQAKHHIHMEYYIFRADHIGTRIQQILIAKARAGVSVRFMYDAVGSFQLSRAFLKELVDAGVQVASYGNSTSFFSSRVNYRNHRKIVVIDGDVGFMGGLNVGDEYLSRSKTYGFWRDTHMLVRGEAVRTMQIIFLQDWMHTTGEKILEQDYLTPQLHFMTGDGAVQIIASGPDNERRALKNIFFSMITSAEKSVWIASPYFIPDEDILTAIRVAAISGLDVRLLFPAKPDKWIPFLASHSYFPALLEAGVKIYEYEKGFIHSKLLIVDGEIATIGTANMDMRSFHLNFEVNALLLQTESVTRIVADFERDLLSTTQIVQETFMNKRMVVRMLESAARLMSPLL